MSDLFAVECPRWCARPAGHDLAERDRDPDDGAFHRIHRSAPGVGIEQFETVSAGGAVSRGQLRELRVPAVSAHRVSA